MLDKNWYHLRADLIDSQRLFIVLKSSQGVIHVGNLLHRVLTAWGLSHLLSFILPG